MSEISPTFAFVAFNDEGTKVNTMFREYLTHAEAVLLSMPPSAERTLALRKLEESAMWLGKAIARTDGYHR